MDPPIAVILNADSGDQNGELSRQTIEALFRAGGRNVEISVAPEQGLKILAEQHARGDVDVIVAAGGDGTITAIIGADEQGGLFTEFDTNRFQFPEIPYFNKGNFHGAGNLTQNYRAVSPSAHDDALEGENRSTPPTAIILRE